MKISIYLIFTFLFSSCFGLFDSERKSVKINPTGTSMSGMLKQRPSGKRNVGQYTNKVVVVKIDQGMSAALDSNGRISYDKVAQAINTLASLNPQSIFLSFFLSSSEPNKQAVLDAMKATEIPIFVSGISVGGEQNYKIPDFFAFGDNDGHIEDVKRIVFPARDYGVASSGSAVIEFTGSADNYENVPLLIAKNGKLYATLTLKMIEQILGESIVYYKEFLTIGTKALKISENGNIGDGSITAVPTIKYSELLNGSAKDLDGKVIVIDGGMSFTYNGQQKTAAELVAGKAVQLLNTL